MIKFSEIPIILEYHKVMNGGFFSFSLVTFLIQHSPITTCFLWTRTVSKAASVFLFSHSYNFVVFIMFQWTTLICGKSM